MDPRRPKHKQQPPLVVPREEIERALLHPESYRYSLTDADGVNGSASTTVDTVFPDGREHAKIDVIHTHLSMVFLLPNRVYKLKKEVNFGFVDFSTLYKRFQACFAEVQLNKRLAPEVYVGVVPVSMHRETRKITVRCDDFWTPEKNNNLDYWVNDEYGEIIEWAVHMVRLPDDRALIHAIENGALTEEMIDQVTDRVVEFHNDARRGPKIDPFGKEDVIRHNIDENFEQTAPHVGHTVSRNVHDRIKLLTYQHLKELSATIQSRVDLGYTCDSHGDLRLEHIYALDPPRPGIPSRNKSKKKLVIIDCIEFNEQFRFGDPISDVAFLMMDIWRMGRPDLARHLQQQYLKKAAQDTPENSKLFRFYAAYRAVVRAKVSGFRVMDGSLDDDHRASERQRSRCYWLVALSMLSPPAQRPCMLLVGGLPASGKSNLAHMLAGDESQVHWLRADAIRKELVGRNSVDIPLTRQEMGAQLPTTDSEEGSTSEITAGVKGGSFEEGLYAPSVTQRTYDEILIRSVGHLRQGERVVVDATFRDPRQRARFIETAHNEGALFAFIICECDREIVKGRMLVRSKKQHEVSDATWEVYEKMEQQWTMEDLEEMAECALVNTEKEKELTLQRTNVFLRQIELL